MHVEHSVPSIVSDSTISMSTSASFQLTALSSCSLLITYLKEEQQLVKSLQLNTFNKYSLSWYQISALVNSETHVHLFPDI